MHRSVVVLVALGACGSETPGPDAPLPSELPARLSETGLYADFASKRVATDAREFQPAHALWSDAADKTRWIVLPPGTTIDARDYDRWTFPVGTMWFKEFAKDGRRLETRLIWRVSDTGDREKDTLFGAYVWNDDETEAVFEPAGAKDIRGTQHDAPSKDDCWKCHIGEPGRALGFSAVQLGEAVVDLPLDPPPSEAPYVAPNAALGYLHANCGHCHNESGSAWVSSSMVLRLGAGERDVASTRIVQSTVGVPLQFWLGHGYAQRIVAGDPDASALLARMGQRAMNVQMPPIATEVVDPDGVAVVRQWIDSL